MNCMKSKARFSIITVAKEDSDSGHEICIFCISYSSG